VKTGVQEIGKALKTLDSGFRRNDLKKTQIDFFTPSPIEGEGISSCISIYLPSPLAGEGRVRRDIPIFSRLPPSKGMEFLNYWLFTLSSRGKGQGEGEYFIFSHLPFEKEG